MFIKGMKTKKKKVKEKSGVHQKNESKKQKHPGKVAFIKQKKAKIHLNSLKNNNKRKRNIDTHHILSLIRGLVFKKRNKNK
ncbi:hypothetical protein SAFG77S_10863 [Streptomyces afghaniensis]